MVKQVKLSVKVKALIAFAMPILYYLMFLPIWNGKELKKTENHIIDIIQLVSLVFAVINLFFIYVKKDVKNQTVFTAVMVISAFLTCFVGIYFAEGLMGIPPFPPKN